MSTRRIKKRVLEILAAADLSGVLDELAKLPAEDIVNPLFSAICRSEERLRWHGISAMGETVARIADRELESARIIMRRLLWSLNDESGGIGWGAPESLAEIMVQHDGLADEYLHMLTSYMRGDGEELFQDGNFLEHELLQRGLLWGVGRIAAKKPHLLEKREITADLVPYLSSPDDSVRGLAARVLGYLCVHTAVAQLIPLKLDDSVVRLYERGNFFTTSVAKITSEALEFMESDPGKEI